MPPSRLSTRTMGSACPIFSVLSTLGGLVKPLPITQYAVAPRPAKYGLYGEFSSSAAMKRISLRFAG